MKEYRIFETLFDMIPFGIYVTNMKTYEIVYMNSIFRNKFGEPKGRKCYELIFGNEEPCLFCKINALYDIMHDSESEAIVFDQFNDKDDRYYRMEERAIYWPNGDIVKYTIAIDTTAQKETQNSLAEAHARLMLQSKELENKNAELLDLYEKTRDMAEKDHLTGLYNRRFFYEIGQSMLNMIARQKLKGYLVVIDIDHFKEINDTHGHIAGDEVLCSVAAIFQNSFRKSDLLGRIGGEEFALVLSDITREHLESVLEKLRKEVENNVVDLGDRQEASCTISIGAAAIESGDISVSLYAADQTMYEAKKQGRNRVVIA